MFLPFFCDIALAHKSVQQHLPMILKPMLVISLRQLMLNIDKYAQLLHGVNFPHWYKQLKRLFKVRVVEWGLKEQSPSTQKA